VQQSVSIPFIGPALDTGGPGTAGDASGANAIEKEFVAGRAKSAWQLRLQLSDTPFELEKLATTIAMKMMVVLLAGNLVAGRIAGNLDGLKPAFLDQTLNIPVNRRDSKRRMMALRCFERFIGREWAIRFDEGVTNRGLLFGISLISHAKNGFSINFIRAFPCGAQDRRLHQI